MVRYVGLVLAVLVTIVGCGKKSPADKVTYVADDDPRMDAAMKKARSTVNTFTAALNSPKAGQSAFSIKMAFSDGTNAEHMWLIPVRFDGKKFHGTVNNKPEKVSNVKIGDKVSISPAEISDWMYVEKRKLVGGFTLRVLRDALPASERADFDKSVPFVID